MWNVCPFEEPFVQASNVHAFSMTCAGTSVVVEPVPAGGRSFIGSAGCRSGSGCGTTCPVRSFRVGRSASGHLMPTSSGPR